MIAMIGGMHMHNISYGYVRVSTKEQHTDRQTKALTDFGIVGEHIFTDKLSGKDFDRKRTMITRLPNEARL